MRSRFLPPLPLVFGALAAFLAVRLASHDARYLVLLGVLGLVVLTLALLSRHRTRKLLLSGDVARVLGSWEGSIAQASHKDTLGPLMAATAYASYGWVEASRRALSRAAKGPAWDAALEQRLFVEALLDAFEGDRGAATRKAAELARMPMPATGPITRRRIARLRHGLGALVRAFSHESTPEDARILDDAANASPLIHWAMRYARAIVAIDGGRPGDVQDLIGSAPEWPSESAFRAYHDELLSHAR